MIKIDFLWYQTDTGFRKLDLAVDVVTEHVNAPGALVDERSNNANSRRLAGAVRSEQCKKVSLLDVEVDPFQGYDAIGIGLA